MFTNALAFISEANVPRYQRVQGTWLTVFAHLVAMVWARIIAGIATWSFVHRDVD